MTSGKVVAVSDYSRATTTTGQHGSNLTRENIPGGNYAKGHITVNGVRLMDLRGKHNHSITKKTTSRKHSPRKTTKEHPPPTPSSGSMLKYLVRKKSAGHTHTHTGEAGQEDNSVVVGRQPTTATQTTSPSSCSTTRPVNNHTADPVLNMKKTFKNLVVPGPRRSIQDNIRLFQWMSEGGGADLEAGRVQSTMLNCVEV